MSGYAAATAARPVVTQSDTDGVLVERAKAGDAEAFASLVEQNETAVYNLAYRFMRNATLAEDMAQEAFVKAFRLLKGFRGDCAFSTWLYRVTSSVCLTELGRRKRRQELPLEPYRDRIGSEDPVSLESEEFKELVRACVQRLPARYAKAITLYYLEELSYEEVAEVMGIPMGTLKTWMHRARAKLRKHVEEELASHGGT